MAAPSMATRTPPPNMPAFLQQTKAEIHAKFVDLEWQQRNRLAAGLASTPEEPHEFYRLTGDDITRRNRYLNVEPYAAKRIKLQVASGQNDYINASPIVLGKRKYIAAQGPKDTGVNHFYRMLDAEIASPAIVVMLTQTHEAGKEKCFQYFPASAADSPLAIPPDPEAADDFSGEVTLLSLTSDAPSRTQTRLLRLRTRHADKAVHHLLFAGWPDFLVPEGADRHALLQLIHLSAALNAPRSSAPTNGSAATAQHNPRLIHCSAGVGRSGTFIALDYLLALLRAGGLDALPPDRDPVAETVDDLRRQRMMMVQGEAQFNFLYEVLREQWADRERREGKRAQAIVAAGDASRDGMRGSEGSRA